MTIFQTKLKNLILTLVVGILITGNVCADSASPKKPSQPQKNTPPTTDFTRQRPRLERTKQDTITLPASKSNKPSVSITEDVTPKPVPLPAKPNIPPVAKPVDPPVAIPRPLPVPKPPMVPQPSRPTPRLPVQEPVLNLINPIGPDRRNQPLDRNFYVQQTVRDYHTHVHKYPVPLYRNQGFVNYPSTYSWINNNRYYYGCYYRNYNYITCYDWFNRRFSIIAMPVQNPVYPIVSTYTPVAYCQSLDTNGFLGPMLMLLRIAQGNYSCLTLIN